MWHGHLGRDCRLAQTLPFNVCDAPKAQFGRGGLLTAACPFGTSETPQTGVCAIPKGVAES